MFNNIFPKIVPLGDNVEKYGTAGQDTNDNTIQCRLQTHTQKSYAIRNCISKATWLHERA